MSRISMIEDDLKKIKMLENNLLWYGEASDIYRSHYENNVKDIKAKLDILVQYIEFLDVFNNKYNKAQETIIEGYNYSKEVTNEKETYYHHPGGASGAVQPCSGETCGKGKH